MKTILKYWLMVATLVAATSCDNGFEDLNTNKIGVTSINPVFMLNDAVTFTALPLGTVIYDVGIVQQIVTPNSGILTGANFNLDNRTATQELWQRYYRNTIRNTVSVINQVANDPTRTNLLQMARILKAFAFMVMTDTYGDVPYSEAGKGFIGQVVLPRYDPQETIYKEIIRELTEASAALDATKPTESADILYIGDVTKWRKLGYSLLLRAGMRLSLVAPELAAQTVKLAFEKGVFQSNSDNFMILHNANFLNPIGNGLNATEANNFFLAAPFVTHLKTTADPRLKAIAVRYVGATSGPQMVPSRGSTDPEVQIGMPLGYDNNTISGPVAASKLASFYDYSQVDRNRMVKLQSPSFLVTYAQTQLLLAEAVQRNWITGSAATLYEQGIRAHMEQMALYDAACAVPPAAITTYLAANPLVPAKALEQINTQYWIASFLNGPETFANFRRSGFPALTPNPFPGKGIKGNFINRLTYPNSELSVNSGNLNEAVSRQGPDDLDTKVWWHK